MIMHESMSAKTSTSSLRVVRLQSGNASFISSQSLYRVFRNPLKQLMPRTQQYSVHLSADERAELNAMLSAGTYKTRELSRARCLFHADDGLTDPEPSEAVGCHPGTVGRLRKRYTKDSLAAITRRKADSLHEPKLSRSHREPHELFQ